MISRQRASAIVAVGLLAAIAWLLATRSDATPAAPPPDTGASAAPTPPPASADQGSAPTDPPLVRTDLATPTGADAAPSPTELWGRVIAADTHEPVAGADVRLQHRDADEFWNLDRAYGERIDELGRATSGRDGRFRFDVARARAHRLHVTAAGFAPRTLLDCTGGAEVVVELTSGATLDGLVRCAGGPVAGASVRIAVVGKSVTLAEGSAGADGRFHLAGLQPASVFVQVWSPVHAETWKPLELTGGKAHTIEIDLPESAALRGRVIDAASRAPIAEAEIAASWTYKHAARSGADGSFTLAGLSAHGAIELHVRAADYAAASRTLTSTKEPVEIALERGGEVTGRLGDVAGEPIASAYVAVASSFRIAFGEHTDWIRASLDGRGLFRAAGLRTDQHYWLYARARGHGARVYALPRPLASGERIDLGDLVLRAGGGVEGRVVDGSGAPVAGREVSIRGHNDDARALLQASLRPSNVSQFETRDVNTDAHGRFRATGLAAGGTFRFAELIDGTYVILLFRGPSGWSLPPRRGIATGTTDVELVLQPAATIAGRVLDEAGNGVRANVWAQAADVPGLPAPPHTSGDDGSFRIEVPPGFRGSVRATHPDDQMRHATRNDVAAEEQDVVLRLPPAGPPPAGARRR